jgi:hypothetical protein
MAHDKNDPQAPAAHPRAHEKQPVILSCSHVFNQDQCKTEFAIHGRHFDLFVVDKNPEVDVRIEYLEEDGAQPVTLRGKVLSETLITAEFSHLPSRRDKDRGPSSGGISTTIGNNRCKYVAHQSHLAAY